MSGPGKALLWSAILLMAVLALGAVVLTARWLYVKRLKWRTGEAFAMERLEEMRDGGLISAEEFARLRRGALGLAEQDEEKRQSMSSTDAKVDDGTKDAGGDRGPRQNEEHP